MLSFFHNYLLFMTLHFCVKSTIKIVVCSVLYVTRVRRIRVIATRSFDEYALNVDFTISHFKFTFWFDPICEMFKSEKKNNNNSRFST